MSAAPLCLWQASGLEDCHWASWEPGEYFLFNPASGRTHLLNELGRTLLQQIAETPRDTRELTTLIWDDGEPVPAEGPAMIEAQLQQLHLIGLVERIR